MNEFTKNVLLMFFTAMLGAAISSFSTVSSLSSEIASLAKSVDRTHVKLDKFDDRIRQNQIDLAQYRRTYLAAN